MTESPGSLEAVSHRRRGCRFPGVDVRAQFMPGDAGGRLHHDDVLRRQRLLLTQPFGDRALSKSEQASHRRLRAERDDRSREGSGRIKGWRSTRHTGWLIPQEYSCQQQSTIAEYSRRIIPAW